MKQFKPYLHLSQLSKKNFELSVIIPVKEGYLLKEFPTPQSDGKMHLVVFEFVRDESATASIIDTRIKLTPDKEIKVEVHVELLPKPDVLNPRGKSSAHYGDPEKEI
jgi:hypothetical protein